VVIILKVKIENNGWINGNDNRICLQLTREEIGNIIKIWKDKLEEKKILDYYIINKKYNHLL